MRLASVPVKLETGVATRHIRTSMKRGRPLACDITLEPGEHRESRPCACCGRPILTAIGFVYRNGDAYSVYHAAWSPGHPARGASIALQFGDWSEDAGPDDRFRVGLEIRATLSEYQFEVREPADSMWADSSDVRMLTRDEALAHAQKTEFFRVAEHVIFGDQRIKQWMEGQPEKDSPPSEPDLFQGAKP
jgi:hypothetical protein